MFKIRISQNLHQEDGLHSGKGPGLWDVKAEVVGQSWSGLRLESRLAFSGSCGDHSHGQDRYYRNLFKRISSKKLQNLR